LSNFDFGGYEDGGSYRAFIGGTVSPGASYTYEFDITAPMEEGVARIVLQMVQDGVRWMPGIYSKVITVTSDSIPHDGQIPPEQPAGANEIVYPMMFWTTLANADYHIAQKAFFWDLSPDERIAPIDDRGQAVGEDVRTLNKILFAQAQQSGFNIFNVSGFVPWNFKYTSTSDPGVSSMGDVDSEWTMINRISSYGGQTEADANAGVGDVSNCSVFMHVPLNDELKQNNDKGRSDTRTRVSGRHYFTIYMGDYDSGSWTSSILSMLWANSKDDRGKYPLSWPIPTGISGRIPQLFNYLYDNATQNDFFVAGNNGTAYLNSSMFEPNLRPSGMPDMLETWENYNIAMNRRFDIDVLGFHINTSTSTLSNAIPTQRVFESIARMAPVGASVQSQTNVMVESGSILNRTYSPRLITNASNGAVTPVINYRDIGGAGTTAQELANNIYNIINTNNGSARTQNFHSFRCILIPPSVINEALDLLASGTITGVSQSTARSRLNYEVVDPYTMYRLAGQKWGEQTVSFDSNGGSDVDSIGATTRDLIYDIPADPTKEDHAFLGWYANEALTTPWDFAKDTIWEDITLYAKWKISDAGFLEERAAEILKNGLTKEQLILSANNNATLTLVINGREFIIALGVNNRNVSGSVELADGSGTLVFDIRGNGSNVVIFKIVR
ncbi:MAG: InlB B-repeat-containing protein, partial [Oscillospiraceae bacterium]|nr:InlB B-repeat-containing protein [Oscillospiraceae bacterium]